MDAIKVSISASFVHFLLEIHRRFVLLSNQRRFFPLQRIDHDFKESFDRGSQELEGLASTAGHGHRF